MPNAARAQGRAFDEVGAGQRLTPVAVTAGGLAVPPVRADAEPTNVLYGADVRTPRRDARRRGVLVAADGLALVLAFATVGAISPQLDPSPGDLWLLAVLPLWVLLNTGLRLYDRDSHLIHKSTLDELPTLLQSVSLGAAALFMAGPSVGGVALEREPTLLLWASACVLVPALRSSARGVVRRAVEPERLLIIGSGHVASLVARKIAGHPEYGARVVGFVDLPSEHGDVTSENGVHHLGDLADFEAVCREHDVERVVIAFSSLAHEHLLDTIRVAKRLHLKISVVPRLFEVIGHGVEIDQVEGMTVLGLRGLRRTQSTLVLKRAMDVVGAGVMLVVALPVMLVAAAAVKATSPGPVFFVQARVGRGNRPFPMFKFRTMVVGADAMKPELAHLNEMADRTMFKIRDDPRVTRAGRLLRATSIDELPQLLNVLRGEMSLVGPRPLVPDENDHIIGWHRARLDLTPGLTGPWQVMGRNTIPFDEMVKLDYLYVTEWSLWNDLKLLVRTLPVVLGRRGS